MLLPMQYAAIVLASTLVLNRLNLNATTIFAISVGIILSYIHATKTHVKSIREGNELLSIIESYDVNSDAHRSALNFLRVARSIPTHTHPNQAYDNLVELKNKVQNDFHSLIHNNDTLNDDLKRVTKLLNQELDSALTHVNAFNQKEGVNTRTKFHYRNHPGGNDNEFDQHWSFFQRA